MRLAVCLKHVITRESHLRINDAQTWIRDEAAAFELNEPDAYALEEALRLREQHGGEVIAVSAGPDRVTHVLREALARGADSAIHVAGDHLATADARTTAAALVEAVRKRPVDLLLSGLQSDDQGFGQVGVVLAELLGVPHVSLAVAIESTGDRLRVKRELEGGWFQWISLPLPALVTVQSGINQLRYATLKGIMAARKKEIQRVEVTAPQSSDLRIVALQAPERKKTTEIIPGAASDAARELIRRLRETGSVG